jgi:hypothetical protein
LIGRRHVGRGQAERYAKALPVSEGWPPRLEDSTIWIYHHQQPSPGLQPQSGRTESQRRPDAKLTPLSLIFAILDHPWLKSALSDGQAATDHAAVRIAMTVGERGEHRGHLYRVKSEGDTSAESTHVELKEETLCANISEAGSPTTIIVGRGKKSHFDQHKQDKYFFRWVGSFSAMNGEDDFTALGTVRRAWIRGRCIGRANVEGEYADIYAIGWVSHLRAALASIAVKRGMEDIDLSSLERSEPRLLRQQAGRITFELGYAGVCYHPRYGHSIENWEIFED